MEWNEDGGNVRSGSGGDKDTDCADVDSDTDS